MMRESKYSMYKGGQMLSYVPAIQCRLNYGKRVALIKFEFCNK